MGAAVSIHVPPPRAARLLTGAETDAEIARVLRAVPMKPAWSRTHRRVVRRPGYALRYVGRYRGDSPAMKVALAAFEDHGRRWVQARRDTLAELGCTDAPCRDRAPDLRIESTPRRPMGASL